MKNIRTFLMLQMLLLSNVLFLFSPVANAQNSIFDTSAASLFSNNDEFLQVDDAFIFDALQHKNKVNVSFTIQEGYYLYRHQFKFIATNATITDVELPQGEDHEDEFFGVQQVYRGILSFTVNITEASQDANLAIRYQGCADKGLCYPPTTKLTPLDVVNAANQNDVLSALALGNDEQQPTVELSQETQAANDKKIAKSEQFELLDILQSDSIALILFAFFTGGLLLSFTPCVFPMYPILTGIIVGQGDKLSTKQAFSLSFFYVQGMAITYTILGVVVALAGAQFQAMFQHPAVLIVLSILFVFLALSMFGVINLALPSSWQNKLNQISQQQKGGSYTGVTAMGAISGLVASPCTTAPLTGALIYISQTGDVLLGGLALYVLSLGMGLPLLILGSSGGKILPKAGNWMNVIKNIFGLLLLAVPIFLLERFISETASQLLWILLTLASATYFYVVNLATTKNFAFGVRSLVIFIMLFFGLIQLHSVIFPPKTPVSITKTSSDNPTETASHNEFVHVNNLTELKALIVESNQQGKTVMLDLYADWCIACKEFEEYTFPKPQVQAALINTVLVQIDLTDTGSEASLELMETFDVFGLPSILFFDLSGNELTEQRVTGFMGADEFSTHIKTFF